MPKKLNYELTKEQLATIEEAIRYEKDARVVKRATAIRLLHQGHSPQEVAEMLLVSDAVVYNWHHRWAEQGLDGLRDQPRPGRPRVADEAYCQALEEALDHDPGDYGYDFAIWTVDRLRDHLAEQTGKMLSGNRLREVMAELGYVYRRPSEDLTHAQDAEVRQQAEALIEELKRGPKQAMLSSSLWTKQP
jgi:transposase